MSWWASESWWGVRQRPGGAGACKVKEKASTKVTFLWWTVHEAPPAAMGAMASLGHQWGWSLSFASSSPVPRTHALIIWRLCAVYGSLEALHILYRTSVCKTEHLKLLSWDRENAIFCGTGGPLQSSERCIYINVKTE